jgi:hypothetical protein
LPFSSFFEISAELKDWEEREEVYFDERGTEDQK